MEYLSGLFVSVLILLVGAELARSSFEKILHPEPVAFSALSFAVLGASILVKLWMALFCGGLSRRIGSTALRATAQDSRNDVITTAAVLIGCVLGHVLHWQVDGWIGLLVALFILWSGWSAAKDTISPLLGEPASEELVQSISRLILSHEKILGIHDLMVHDYGPGQCFASVHAEMDSREDPLLCHDVLDDIERDALRELRVHLVIHYDPIVTDDAELNHMRTFVQETIRAIDPELTLHDFRMVRGAQHTNLIFDLAVPFDLSGKTAELKRRIWEKKAEFYTLDAVNIAKDLGLGGRINMVMQAGFFALSKIFPVEEAVAYLKAEVSKTYGAKGQDIVDMNCAAIDQGVRQIRKITVPESWATAQDVPDDSRAAAPEFFQKVLFKMGRQEGNDLPVSAFNGHEDGSWEQSYTRWEKRGIAIEVPAWDAAKCVECNRCSAVCSHAVIRPTLLTAEEAAAAPEGYECKKAIGFEGMQYHLSLSGMDCTGCGVCVKACPAKALSMQPFEPVRDTMKANWAYSTEKVTEKTIPEKQKTTVKGSQFLKPYVEFSGACAGCGETPYIKMITQLYGDHMRIANSAGCTHIWGGSPEIPFCTNDRGQGVAWASGLFEDTAEYGYGMMLGTSAVRKWLRAEVEQLLPSADAELQAAAEACLAGWDDSHGTRERADRLVAALERVDSDAARTILQRKDYLFKPSQWIVGGDGWAYDIGYGGLDHVIASGEDMNMFVFNTEV